MIPLSVIIEKNIYKMNIQVEKLKIIEYILNTQNEKLIDRIIEMFEVDNQVVNEELSEEELQILDLAIAQMENNETINFTEFISSHK